MEASDALKEFNERLNTVEGMATKRLKALLAEDESLREVIAQEMSKAMTTMHVFSVLPKKESNKLYGYIVCYKVVVKITDQIIKSLQKEENDAAGH